MRQAINLVKEVCGESHPETIVARERLESMLREESTGIQEEINGLNTKLRS